MPKGIQITKGELRALVWQEPITALAKRFNLSPNGLAKICDRLDIDRPPKGYWAGPEALRQAPPTFISDDADEIVQIGGRRHGARRRQTRMSLEDRREQIMEYAKQIVISEGVHNVTLRGIARQIGISEAQAYNCFESRTDLLVDLTVRELESFENERRKVVSRGGDRVSKVLLSTLLYLRMASERGAITMRLLALADVRERVAAHQAARRRVVRERQVQHLIEDRGVSAEKALLDVALFGHLTLRAGNMVSQRKLSISEAQQLILPTILQTASSRE